MQSDTARRRADRSRKIDLPLEGEMPAGRGGSLGTVTAGKGGQRPELLRQLPASPAAQPIAPTTSSTVSNTAPSGAGGLAIMITGSPNSRAASTLA